MNTEKESHVRAILNQKLDRLSTNLVTIIEQGERRTNERMDQLDREMAQLKKLLSDESHRRAQDVATLHIDLRDWASYIRSSIIGLTRTLRRPSFLDRLKWLIQGETVIDWPKSISIEERTSDDQATKS